MNLELVHQRPVCGEPRLHTRDLTLDLWLEGSRSDAYIDKKFVTEQAMTDLDERLTAAGVDHQVHEAVGVDIGVDIGDEIVRVAEQNHAELVVIGIRPRSPVGKVLMGSVARTVIMDAPCPVLTVRPDVL